MIKYIEMLKKIKGAFQESEFFPPASVEKIDKYAQEKNIYIPQSYKELLIHTNGCELFGRYAILYGINNFPKPSIGYDFSNGLVPKEYLILGFMNSKHICYSKKKDAFFFFEYEEPSQYYNDFSEILDYIIDICTN